MSLMRIEDLFHFEKGVLQSSKCTEGEFDFITASSEWKTHNEYTHDCEALVFAAAASGSLGRTHYVNGKFISSDLCFIITPKDPINFPIDLKFYHMIFNEFKNDIVKNTKAGTSKEAIGMKAFGNYKLPYFEISKQTETKIQFVNMQVSKVELNSELTNLLNLIKQLRQAFLREAMQGKLCHAELVSASQETGHVLLSKIKAKKAQLIADKKLKKEKELAPISEDEIPFKIPEHWTWCRLGEITKVKVGSTPSRNESKFWKGNIPWVSSGEVANNFIYDTKEKITQEGFDNTSLIIYPKGSVLVAMIGQGKTRGQTAILKTDATTNQNVAGMIIQHDYLVSEYLWYFFLSRYEITRGGASGGNQPALNGIKISNTIFPLPPLHDQEQIVTKLEELMAFCDSLEKSIKESQGYNEKLLQQVLREALQSN
jgi:type I restriction enzyme S subunit